MPEFHVRSGDRIGAQPAIVFAILADYRKEHPGVLPRPPFTTLDVVEGGTGAGTVIDVGMRVLGQERRIRGVVSEPEPGRVLAETYDDPTVEITTFTVDPAEGGTTFLTIATRGRTPHEGLLGRIEQIFIGWFLGGVYRKELALIDARAKRTRAAA